MVMDYVSAELVKLFNNIARYVHFAVANQFALVATLLEPTFARLGQPTTNILESHRYARTDRWDLFAQRFWDDQ